ncbi:MAG: hypothetical protein GY862_30175, partial [Gammaproteobacteria bacterium]|nr:hypothetical protein [Gammaproteobacteria bacterium]
WMEHDLFDAIAARAYGVYKQRMPSAGVFSAPMTIRHFFMGIARSGHYRSRVLDVKHNVQVVRAPDEQMLFDFMSHIGMQGSYLEGSVLDQLFGRNTHPAVSTAQILMEANARNIPIYTVTRANIDRVLPQLNVSAEIKADIAHAVNSGRQAIVPKHDLALGNWTGIGYIIQDLATGAGAYLIDGGWNGGSWEGCGLTLLPPVNGTKRKKFKKALKHFEARQWKLKMELTARKKQSMKLSSDEKYDFTFRFNELASEFIRTVTSLGTKALMESPECFVVTAGWIYKKDSYYALLKNNESETLVLLDAKPVIEDMECKNHEWKITHEGSGESEVISNGSSITHPFKKLGKHIVKTKVECKYKGDKKYIKLDDDTDVTVFTVEKVTARSDKFGSEGSFGVNPVEFKPDKDYSSNKPDAPPPDGPEGTSLNVFFKYIKKDDDTPGDFDIFLKMHVKPELDISLEDLFVKWRKVKGPNSGDFDKTDKFAVKYQKPKKGGLYVFQTVLKLDEAESKTEVFVLMPWAGAGIDAWLVNEVDGM